MLILLRYLITIIGISLYWHQVFADPQQDVKDYQQYYQQRFPNLSLQDYANGAYALDEKAKLNWLDIEEFPPYEQEIDQGSELFNTPFANGQSYASCFENGGIAIAQNYPYWDKKQQSVITLPLAINQCREKNQEPVLGYDSFDMLALTAYLAYTARGQTINIQIPEQDTKALAAYQQGKDYYFTRRGQLNFSCSHCHYQYPGYKLRSELLSPALGHTSHWPVYRAKWGGLGSLHRRFRGCHRQIKAKPEPQQCENYRNLEYFLSHMSNGIKLNGPSYRK